MDKLTIHFEDDTPEIQIVSFNEAETKRILSDDNPILLDESSKRYKVKIYKLNNGILAQVEQGLTRSIWVKDIEGFHIIRTRASLYKIGAHSTFYSTSYIDKRSIERILERKKAVVLEDYSTKNVKLFKLDDGKYFHISYLSYKDFEQVNAELYNSLEEIKKLYLLESIKENMQED